MGSNRIPYEDITILSVYAAPEGVRKIAQSFPGIHIAVVLLSDTVDSNGFLVPYTNGDLGDKLFNTKKGMS